MHILYDFLPPCSLFNLMLRSSGFRLPLEDGMDLLDKRTQRLAMRKALSQSVLQPQSAGPLSLSEASAHLPKLQHAKSDLPRDGFAASPKHSLKALKVRVKPEPKLEKAQQLNGLESPAAAEFVQQRRSKHGMHTPRDHHTLGSDATPRSRNSLHPCPRTHQLSSHPSAPMAQLVESDLFSDFSPRKSSLEAHVSAPVASPRLQAPAPNAPSDQQPSATALPEAELARSIPDAQPRTGLKVTLKHRLSVTDAAKAAAVHSAVTEQPGTPAEKLSPASVLEAAEAATPMQQPDSLVKLASAPAQKVIAVLTCLSSDLCVPIFSWQI